MLGRILFAMAATFVAASAATAQVFDEAAFVRQVHEQYIQRAPSAQESQYWTDQLRRGKTPDDVLSYIIGSDPYFNRNQRNVSAWIDGTFLETQKRRPTDAERQYWTDRLRYLNNDRVAWAKEYLRSISNSSRPVSVAPTSVANPTGLAPGQNVPGQNAAGQNAAGQYAPGQFAPVQDLPGRLVSTCQLLSQSVAQEVTGDRQWLIQMQANNLLNTATSSRDVLRQTATRPTDALSAYRYTRQAFDALQSSLNQLGYAPATSQYYMSQIDDILTSLARTIPGAAPLMAPPGGTSSPQSPIVSKPAIPDPQVSPAGFAPNRPVDADQLIAKTTELSRQTRNFVLLVRDVGSRDYSYDRVLRDADAFSASVGLLRNNLQFGYSSTELRSHILDLRRQATNLSRDLKAATFDGQVSQSWYQTSATFNQLATLAGVGQSDFADASRAVPIVRPTFSGLPYNLPPPPVSAGPSAEFIASVDQALSQCDALIAAYGIYGYYSALVPQLISELRLLRNQLSDLRRQGAQPGVGSIQASAAAIGDQTQRVQDRWAQIDASGQLRGAPDLTALNQSLQRVQQACASPY